MGYNGAGTFVRSNGVHSGSDVWAQDRNAGTKILASRHDAHDQDIANALSNCMTRDGQSPATANIPLGGFQLVNVGTGTARSSAAPVSQVQDGATVWGGTATNVGNAYSIALSPPITAYTAGQRFVFRVSAGNTGAVTLNVNGLGAVSVRLPGHVQLSGGEWVANQVIEVVHDGSYFVVPQYYPSARTWTPALSAFAPMTMSGAVVTTASYLRVGHFVLFSLRATFSLDGTATTDLNFTLPTDAQHSPSDLPVVATAAINEGGFQWYAGVVRASSSSSLNVRWYDSRTWTVGGAAHILQVSGHYLSVPS